MAGQIQCAHILVKTYDEALAIKKQIQAGEDFALLARGKSICPSAKDSGDLGRFKPGDMVPEFEKAAFALNSGEISDIVKTKFGYHIIKRLS